MAQRRDAETLIGMLRAWFDGQGRVVWEGADRAAVRELVRQNRIEPLMGTLSGADEASWRTAYKRCLFYGLSRLKDAQVLLDRLEGEGIAVIPSRGPFAGTRLYGDVAARHFSDLDFLVKQSDSDRAWAVFADLRFSLINAPVPRDVYRRHHLAWPLVGPEGLQVDLHWAVDHPYKLRAVDYDAVFEGCGWYEGDGMRWRVPCREHELLIGALHLDKECRLDGSGETGVAAAVEWVLAGQLRHWLDAGLMVQRFGDDMDWDALVRTARAWRAEWPLRVTLEGVRDAFGVAVPGAVRAALGTAAPPVVPGWVRRLSEGRLVTRLGQRCSVRGQCFADAYAYLFPSGLGVGRRVRHTVTAAAKLARAGWDLARCSVGGAGGQTGKVSRASRSRVAK